MAIAWKAMAIGAEPFSEVLAEGAWGNRFFQDGVPPPSIPNQALFADQAADFFEGLLGHHSE